MRVIPKSIATSTLERQCVSYYKTANIRTSNGGIGMKLTSSKPTLDDNDNKKHSKNLKMARYTLTYFDIRARGEAIRLLFKYAGVEFKDVRIQRADWPKIKPTTPTGKLPYLEVDGKILPESGAILRYLARQFKLIGDNELETAFADSVVETYRDFKANIRPYVHVSAGLANGNADELYKDVYVPNRDIAFKYLESVLAKSESDFIVDSGVTYADIFIAEHITTLLYLDPSFEKALPQFVDYQQKVFALPQIKDYVASRKVSKV
uniref:glutathione transferase n=1 Tax=Panagrellus redivivus TaxID=6233 RepID=A0A7E4UN18_PANRE